METIRINTLLPMRNKFIYAVTVEFLCAGSNESFEGIYDISDVEGFVPEKVVETLEKVIVERREVGRVWSSVS